MGILPAETLALSLLILFAAAIVKVTLGFGDALLAMPLLTLVLGIRLATPVVALAAVTVTIMMLVGSWRRMDFHTAWRIIAAAAVGIPLGVVGLKYLPAEHVKRGLGVVLILTGVYELTRPALPRLQARVWAYFFGFLAGMFGGAYNAAGLPMVVYGTLVRWNPDEFRATLQSVFFPTSLLVIVSHGLAGLWNTQVMLLMLFWLPLSVLAFWLGSRLQRHIPTHLFARMVQFSLVCLGILMLISL